MASLQRANAQDAFEVAHHELQAKNPPGVTCTLRLTEAKTRYQQGEAIPVVIAYLSSKPNTYKVDTSRFSKPRLDTSGKFFFSPSEGVIDPIDADQLPSAFNYNGPTMPPSSLGEKPVEVPLTLNEWVRFDRPGTYRFYAYNQRVFDATPDANGKVPVFLFSDKGLGVASTIAEVEIVPTNPQWAHQQVQAQIAEWQKPTKGSSHDYQQKPSPLLYLQIPEAMEALIEHFGQQAASNSHSDAQMWRSTFTGFGNRAWLIDAMRSALRRPTYPVTQEFLDLLAELEAVQNPAPLASPPLKSNTILIGGVRRNLADVAHQIAVRTARYKAQITYWQETNDALPRKTGMARSLTLNTLLEFALQSGLGAEGQAIIDAQRPTLIAQLPEVFEALPTPIQEQWLNERRWPCIRSQALIAPLRRLLKLHDIDTSDPKAVLNAFELLRADLLYTRLQELEALPQTH